MFRVGMSMYVCMYVCMFLWLHAQADKLETASYTETYVKWKASANFGVPDFTNGG